MNMFCERERLFYFGPLGCWCRDVDENHRTLFFTDIRQNIAYLWHILIFGGSPRSNMSSRWGFYCLGINKNRRKSGNHLTPEN
jgi:hypothetical protein